MKITREQLIEFAPCDLPRRLEMFGGADEMGVAEAFAAGFTVADVLWVAGRLGLGTDCARVAVFAARQVESLNPDSRVRAAIEAAQACIDDSNPQNPQNRQAAYAAARAAYAAYAAYAADAAADAARAARAAARAARAAADAAAYAADAAAYAARAAAYAARAAYAAADAAADAARAAYAARAAARAAVREFMVALWGVPNRDSARS
jgi:hypothetical protein